MWLFSQGCISLGFKEWRDYAVFLILWSFRWVHPPLPRWKAVVSETVWCITTTCLMPCWPDPVRCSSQSKNKTCSQCDVWNSLTGEGKRELYRLYHLTLGLCENWKILRHGSSLSNHPWVCQQWLQNFIIHYKTFFFFHPSISFCLENSFLLVKVR